MKINSKLLTAQTDNDDISGITGFHSRRRFIARSGMAAAASFVAIAGFGAGWPLIKELNAGTPVAQDAVDLLPFKGTPEKIGIAYGQRFAEIISRNLGILVGTRLPLKDPAFRAWVRSQEKLVGKHWPWLIGEMHGVATGCGASYDDILFLNLRAWQYDFYGKPPGNSCSSLAIRLADGHIACAGALDDPLEYYCGPVHVTPDTGYRFITFPIAGTSWGNRGMNSAGLTVGLSSQLLPGLKRKKKTVMQDLAVRAMLQTCATVAEVREFCLNHPFTINLVCVDAAGGLFSAHHTAAGLREIKVRDAAAMTNHIIDKDTEQWLHKKGAGGFIPSSTTVPRRDKLMQFIASANGKCTPDEVKNLVARRDDTDSGSIYNNGTIYLTYSCPQEEKTTLWIRQPKASKENDSFLPFII